MLCRRLSDGCHCERNQPSALSGAEGEVISIVQRLEIAKATEVASQ